MALVSLQELLNDARKRKYAVGGFNVFNFETLGAVIEVAEELKTPLVLGLPERLFKFVDVEILSAAMVRAASNASVPVALHLDHGHSCEGVLKAIRWGFTSVMFDGSALAFHENVKRTKEIVKIAHSLGVTVEGEMGYSHNIVTNYEIVADYVNKTGVDALAVGVASNHTEAVPLCPDYITNINKVVSVPLVMHGGTRSKLNREDYRKYIDSGIAKINIATDMSVAAVQKLKQELSHNPSSNYIHLMMVVKKGVKESVRKYMLYFDCISKAV